jgi:hypothetical protein
MLLFMGAMAMVESEELIAGMAWAKGVPRNRRSSEKAGDRSSFFAVQNLLIIEQAGLIILTKEYI